MLYVVRKNGDRTPVCLAWVTPLAKLKYQTSLGYTLTLLNTDNSSLANYFSQSFERMIHEFKHDPEYNTKSSVAYLWPDGRILYYVNLIPYKDLMNHFNTPFWFLLVRALVAKGASFLAWLGKLLRRG